jgi:hypothetical protein
MFEWMFFSFDLGKLYVSYITQKVVLKYAQQKRAMQKPF